jgi:hypothetical protein
MTSFNSRGLSENAAAHAGGAWSAEAVEVAEVFFPVLLPARALLRRLRQGKRRTGLLSRASSIAVRSGSQMRYYRAGVACAT